MGPSETTPCEKSSAQDPASWARHPSSKHAMRVACVARDLVHDHPLALLVCTTLLLCACGSTAGSKALPDGSNDAPPDPGAGCVGEGAPQGCGQTCSDLVLCPGGLYCDDGGHCSADCNSDVTCSSGKVCTARGKCLASNGTSDGGANVDGGECASISLDSKPVTPNVMLLVDRSVSMEGPFPTGSGVSRWDRVRGELLAKPDGLIISLEDRVRFGIALYTCTGSGLSLEREAMALNNYQTIHGFWQDKEPLGGTPTGEAINALVADLDKLTPNNTRPGEPTVLILATDGNPNRCSVTPTGGADAYSVAAIEHAYGVGVRSYIISVGNSVTADHMQDMANAGLGRGPGDENAPYWVATDTVELKDSLHTIVGGVRSCRLELQGEIDPEDACSGTVKLGSRSLTCDSTSDGWHAVDATHIELLGTACDDFLQDGGAIEATFPCDVVIVVI